jgi:hypothetical protein
MSCKFNFVKYPKIVFNSATAEAKEKISTDLESLQLYEFLNVGFTKLKKINFGISIQISLIKLTCFPQELPRLPFLPFHLRA